MTTLTTDYFDDGDWSEDGRLARAHLAGDLYAFDTLFRRHRADLVQYLRHRVRDHALAEDLAQETMERALRYLHTFDPHRPLWPWLRTIASRIANAEVVRRASEEPGRQPVDELYSGVESVIDATEAFITRAAVDDCLAHIPRRQRRALTHRYLEDQDATWIAANMGISRAAVEVLLHRGRTNLAREYRARNAGPWLPVFAPLAARFRRVIGDVCARFNAATSAGFGLASDMALSAAITVGGIGIVAGAVSQGAGHQAALGGGSVPATQGHVPMAPADQSIDAKPAAAVGPAGVAPAAIAPYPKHEQVVGAAAADQTGQESGEQQPAPPIATAPTDRVPEPPAEAPQTKVYVHDPDVVEGPQPTPPPAPQVMHAGVGDTAEAPAGASADASVNPDDSRKESTEWADVDAGAEANDTEIPIAHIWVENTSGETVSCALLDLCL